MGKRREIRDSNPNPVSQFNDLVAGFGTRDLSGRPLGDIMGHSVSRLRTCYAILHAARLAAESAVQQLEANTVLEVKPAGAPPQDRAHTHEFPAAHLAPCQLLIERGWALRPNLPLFLIFRDGISRSFVRGLFERTEIVHVLANKADTYCEGFGRKDKFGTAHELARSCNMIMQDHSLKVRDVFFNTLVPSFRSVALDRLSGRSSTLDDRFPNADDISPIVDASGRLYAAPPAPSDNRLGSPHALSQQTNHQASVQILETYANTDTPPTHALDHIAGQFSALRTNEIAACRR